MNLHHFRPRLECLEDRLAPSVDHTIPAVGAEHQAFLDLADAPTYEAVAVQSGAWGEDTTWGAASDPVNSDGQTEEEYYLSWVPPERLDGDPAVPDIPDVWRTTLVDIGQDTLAPFVPVEGGGGHVPGDGDDVHIPEGVTVTLDHRDAARLGTVRVDGTLRFAPDVNTRLMAETILVMPGGRLEIGTDAAPVTAQAEVFFTTYDATLAEDPERLGGGLVSHGEAEFVGAATPTWGPEGTLAPGFTYANTDDGEPLPAGFSHYDYYGSRHVVFRDEGLTPETSAHVMFMHSQDVAVKYAQFGEFGNGLGRTRKSEPVVFTVTDTNSNVPARYGPHFHRTGSAGTPAQVEGVLVVDPTSWGVVNHSSNVDVTDSVVVGAFGSAFQIETAASRGSLTRNLAVDTDGDTSRSFDDGQGVNDLGHAGHGFWVQGTGVVTTDNVAVRAAREGFVAWGRSQPEGDTGVKSDPGSDDRVLATFARNTSVGSEMGFRFIYLNHPDNAAHDLRVAGAGEVGIAVVFANVDLYNPVVHGTGRGYSRGIGFVHGYHGNGSVYGGLVEGFAWGLIPPREGDRVIDGLAFGHNGRDVAVRQRTPGATVFRNLDPGTDFWFDNGPLQERHYSATPKDFTYVLDPADDDPREMFHTWAARDHVPFDSGTYAGLTNQEIADQFGLLPPGGLAPLDAVLVGDLSSGYLLAP